MHFYATPSVIVVSTCRRTVFFTDWYSTSPIDFFDHYNISTSIIFLEAVILDVFRRLPRLRIITSVNDYFPVSLCVNVGPVISFLIEFSVTCFTKSSIFEIGLTLFSSPHEYRIFRTWQIRHLNLSEKILINSSFTRHTTIIIQLYSKHNYAVNNQREYRWRYQLSQILSMSCL